MTVEDGPRVEEYWEVVSKIVKFRGRKLQKYPFFEEVWRAVDEGKRLVILRAPTGGGKTEAAATPFLRDIKSGGRRWLSLIHVLPTRSLVNAMRWRYAEAMGVLGIRNVAVAYEYGQLLGIRPYLDGDIVVTTYDTMLHRFYGVDLKAPHILGQLSKIVNSLLILDELQLLQDEHWYAMSILPYHIKALLAWDAQLILMTATLPTALLEIIINQLRGGLRYAHLEDIVTVSSSSMPARGRLSLTLMGGEMPSSGEQLVQVIREYHAGEGSVIIIANTVEKAAAIYVSLMRSHLEGKTTLKPMLLHSRLRQAVRKEVEELLESKKEGKFILVATQVVEAGLDLDSTLLITEISPIDSLIQRIGRCGRRRDGVVIIYTESEGAIKVYPSLLIEKTRSVVDDFQDLLADSPRDLGTAQTLIDLVFNRETVDYLMRCGERSRAVAKWIERYWISETGITLWAAHHPPDQLLRPGIELQTYMPRSLREYEIFLGGDVVRVKVDEFEKNLVKLGIKEEDDGQRFVMPALLHESGNGHYIALELIVEEWADEVVLTPSKIPAYRMRNRLLVEILDGRKVLLLNPKFYEELESDGVKLELGVVKPWKRNYGNA